ncbi:MAG: histidinol dehydrogenase [bacterium]
MRILKSFEPAHKKIIEELLNRADSLLLDEEIGHRVDDILRRVRKEGDQALLEYTERFDQVKLSVDQLKVSQEEIDGALAEVEAENLQALKRAADNITRFHTGQLRNSHLSLEEEGIILGQIYRPLDRVGIYIPGGTAPLVSTVLMTALPARVAGTGKIIMASPPNKEGKINPYILAAARLSQVDEIYRAGGAQAIAALAYGTETIARVDKIVGPGNIYVALAKSKVYGQVDIDMVAGPSEIVVVADDLANPAFAAADLLSQAEHDPLARSILITLSLETAQKVEKEIERQVETLRRANTCRTSLAQQGAIIVVRDLKEACELVNRIAPEHLELQVSNPWELLGGIKNAGAIFLGNEAGESVGDYMAGPSHVLPTSGTARFASPLGVDDFIKRSSLIAYNRSALAKYGQDIIRLAEIEGLSAHARAIEVRLSVDSSQ